MVVSCSALAMRLRSALTKTSKAKAAAAMRKKAMTSFARWPLSA
jgi:hypothetical protein